MSIFEHPAEDEFFAFTRLNLFSFPETLFFSFFFFKVKESEKLKLFRELYSTNFVPENFSSAVNPQWWIEIKIEIFSSQPGVLVTFRHFLELGTLELDDEKEARILTL